jgi:hypothetical protein
LSAVEAERCNPSSSRLFLDVLILNFCFLVSSFESASQIPKIKMAGPDKNKSKKAGRAKGEAAPVISEYRELLEI